ncbi:FG-GAP repeat domain-containing protein [Singulisphaera sp. PoT]|uniref:FG-GAP repeat domain-containing protein n=1 Tax=Singulisphaera sp. PoT TaxID=3411797 RepID=UPI003BF58941
MQIMRKIFVTVLAFMVLTPPSPSKALDFDRVVIDDDFAGVDQVEMADVNGDGRLDIVALGAGACAWYENPSWKRRIVTNSDQTPRIVSSATADVDGDGKSEIAIAYDFVREDPKRGKLLLAGQGKTLDDPWTLEPLADIGSIHRLRWYYRISVGATGLWFNPVQPGRTPPHQGVISNTIALVAAPLFSPSAEPPGFDQEPSRLMILNFPYTLSSTGGSRPFGMAGRLSDPIAQVASVGGLGGGPMRSIVANRRLPKKPPFSRKIPFAGPFMIWKGGAPGLNSIDVIDRPDSESVSLLTASQSGVTRYSGIVSFGLPGFFPYVLVRGADGLAPAKGASEVRAGRLRDGRQFFVTVEPGQGTEVAAYVPRSTETMKIGPRILLDATLKEVQALCVADVDGDGDGEVFAGGRGSGKGVVMYDPAGSTWVRTVVDASLSANDLRSGDLDKDGAVDIVGVGGESRNVIWYKARARSAPRR